MSFYSFISKHINQYNNNIAIYNSDLSSYTYAQLFEKINEVEKVFNDKGLKENNLVILQVDKSFNSLAYLLCCIKLGMIYIPIDSESPKDRIAKIVESSNANAIIKPDLSIEILNQTEIKIESDACCVLYTSGSTGTPKGVICSSVGLKAFINWSIDKFNITNKDLLTSYAPFHFDLSTFDVFASLTAGASLWLFDKKLSSNVRLIGEHLKTIHPSIWYATPTVYSLLCDFGKLPDDYSPRTVLFAGEVFPIKKLNTLRARWQNCIYYNLYGPTETNVCTFYKIPQKIELNRTNPYPIGKDCPYAKSKINNEGELLVSGDSLMLGYLNNPEAANEKIITENEEKWYKTGDIVTIENDELIYNGRIDRMIKRRGYRIELGEIEQEILTHEAITNVAAISIFKNDTPKIIVYYTGNKSSQIELQTFSAKVLLNYMIPDKFIFIETLPINKNGKIDYKQLIANFNHDE